jgi:hypothetical protein
MRLRSILGLTVSITSILITGCPQQQDDPIIDDPVSSLNALVKEYGYIGYQNPLDEAKSGTMLAGRPAALAFVAHAEDCFPEERIPRYFDRSNFTKKHTYVFKGGFGFLANANGLFSAGFNLKSNYLVNVEMTNMTIEYMSSIDVSRWYSEGMDEVCMNYLDDVGFVIQALKADNMKINIEKADGTKIGLDLNNIEEYFNFDVGVDWEITDSYNVEIKTPKYIGYQLGRLRLEDDGRSLYRAVEANDDQFIFERIALFDDPEVIESEMKSFDEEDDIYLVD